MSVVKKSYYNLGSHSAIQTKCTAEQLHEWFHIEIETIRPLSLRKVIQDVEASLKDFVAWPEKALLLWESCDRIKYHNYPSKLKALAKELRIQLDSRTNGPAIAAFKFAGGIRPQRQGSTNQWSIHHIYSGKFPHDISSNTLHACKSGLHFTQSAGLVAVHPIADALCDESPVFAWRLRAEAYLRFRYDPDKVFSLTHNRFGFSAPDDTTVIFPAQ